MHFKRIRFTGALEARATMAKQIQTFYSRLGCWKLGGKKVGSVLWDQWPFATKSDMKINKKQEKVKKKKKKEIEDQKMCVGSTGHWNLEILSWVHVASKFKAT